MAEKKLTGSAEAKRALIEPNHPDPSIRRQCALLGLSRASYYYAPVPENPMTAALRAQGYHVNGKRVRRLMRQMGLQAITVRKRPATSTPGHRIYPYLLHDVVVERPAQATHGRPNEVVR